MKEEKEKKLNKQEENRKRKKAMQDHGIKENEHEIKRERKPEQLGYLCASHKNKYDKTSTTFAN